MTRSSMLAVVSTLALAVGCPAPRVSSGGPTRARTQPLSSPAARPLAKKAMGAPTERPAEPARPTVRRRPLCKAPEPAAASGHYAASHILIFYQGASRAPARIQRTKAEAHKLAARITALARQPGASFAKLAGQWSEGPTRSRGGRLGRFLPRQMVPPFSAAVKATCIGDVTGPVETPFGFHVIRRDRP